MRKIVNFLQYLVVAIMARILNGLPGPVAYRIGEVLGIIAFFIDRRHRRIALGNLHLAFDGEFPPEKINSIARATFINLGRTLVDVCRMSRINPKNADRIFAFKGMENLNRAKEKGKGVLFVTAHFGPWELLATASALKGEPVNVVVRPLDNPYLDRTINRLRARFGNRVITKKKALKTVLAALNQGENVGILIDQNITWKEGVFVDFFGRLANTVIAPAILALRSHASVLPAVIYRNGMGKYTVAIGEEIQVVRTDNLKTNVALNTAKFTKAIEGYIRESPAEWFWVHQRWKTQPDGENLRWD